MTDPQSLITATFDGLADLLSSVPLQAWDVPSLCENWQVRHVVAHVTMPARFTPEQFGAEMAAAGGDFTVASDTIAARDASQPITNQLDALRSPALHQWQPPGGGATGALSHAVIHSLDITLALDRPVVAPQDAVLAVLDVLATANGEIFGINLAGVRLEATDTDWSWGNGHTIRAESNQLVALLSGRVLPDGRVLSGGRVLSRGEVAPGAR